MRIHVLKWLYEWIHFQLHTIGDNSFVLGTLWLRDFCRVSLHNTTAMNMWPANTKRAVTLNLQDQMQKHHIIHTVLKWCVCMFLISMS